MVHLTLSSQIFWKSLSQFSRVSTLLFRFPHGTRSKQNQSPGGLQSSLPNSVGSSKISCPLPALCQSLYWRSWCIIISLRILTALERRVIIHSLHRRLRLVKWTQHFPNVNMHVNHLGGLLEFRFWSSGSGAGLSICLSNHLLVILISPGHSRSGK